jgi:hypothetical protein
MDVVSMVLIFDGLIQTKGLTKYLTGSNIQKHVLNPHLITHKTMFKAFFSVAVAFSLSAGTAHAYLSPADVFTDLDIPAANEATDQGGTSDTENVFAPEPAPAPEPPTKAPPAFFRSGEKIEQGVILEEDTTTTESPFEEESAVIEESDILIPSLPTTNTVDEESEAILEEMQQEEVLEEEMAEEESEDEVSQAAAPRKKKSVAMALLGRMKYLGGGVILGGIAFAFFKRKKKLRTVAAGGSEKHPTIPAPEKPQQVEESSERLEHALEAMGAKPSTEPTKESGDNSVGFSETPLPGEKENQQ